jgi:hypothetical protein
LLLTRVKKLHLSGFTTKAIIFFVKVIFLENRTGHANAAFFLVYTFTLAKSTKDPFHVVFLSYVAHHRRHITRHVFHLAHKCIGWAFHTQTLFQTFLCFGYCAHG